MADELRERAAAMARREAAAQLRPAPFVPTDGTGTLVAVRLVACRSCGALPRERHWTPPFAPAGTEAPARGPVLAMLACEAVTARAVLPIVRTAERFPELREARFRTRAVLWDALSPATPPAEALALVDASERWIDAPGETPDGEAAAPGGEAARTLPASTRPHRGPRGWRWHRADLVPHFLSPHRNLPTRIGEHYAAEFRRALRTGHEGS
ncbi:hypothetical protein OG979_32160 [Actinomadura citrea]|uniref:hypothetical protein n=1 Tax=Actinomadura citrea TaxID=46158 RepID=UPI002E2CE9AF|nr:hypothetical protein [Actinomadura citrea]